MLDPWRPRAGLLRALGVGGFALDVGAMVLAALALDAAAHWALRALLVVLIIGLALRSFVRVVDGVRRWRQRGAWTNRSGNQWARPARVVRPSGVDDIVEAVQAADAEGYALRAVGAALSFSDAAVASDVLVETRQMNALLPLDHLRAGVESETLIRVEAGATFAKVNRALAERKLALVNLGGYDGLTVGGAIATGVHGSGLRFGPIADAVVSLDVVAHGGTVYRIEPADGITDPSVYPASRGQLVQRDEWFYAAVVNLGSLGIVHSVTLRARAAYRLEESRELTTWARVRQQLIVPKALSREHRVEFFINPYPRAGSDEHVCVRTRREERDPHGPRRFSQRFRNMLEELLTWVPLSDRALDALFGVMPALIPRMLNGILGAMRDKSYLDASYKVMNVGAVNHFRVIAAEYSVPLGQAAQAIEALFALAARQRQRGLYFTCPVSMRFVCGTRHFMSMHEGEGDWATIEVALLEGTAGGFELLRALGVALVDAEVDVRWHWGQYHAVDDGGRPLRERFPRFGEWFAVYRAMNPRGRFSSVFTRRCGFDDD